MKIGSYELTGQVVPAPLAGYTNAAYRALLHEFSSAYTVSEMISDCALIYKNEETYKMIETRSDDRPVALQLFGGKKETLVEGAILLNKHADFDFLDINLGCPVNKVVKGNAGSAWLKKGREQELYEAIKAVVESVDKPVTVKIRLGWNKEDINCVEVSKLLEKAGVSLIAVHGRTRSQMYEGNADYEWIKKVKEAVNIPVLANGDIDSPYKAKEVLDYTKADGVMIGRACLGNPYLLKRVDTYLKTGVLLDEASFEMQKELCIRHLNMLIAIKGEYVALKEMRSMAPLYFKGFRGSRAGRVALTSINSVNDFNKAIGLVESALENQ